jgi:transcriptional regulator with XRE-family HTH domain
MSRIETGKTTPSIPRLFAFADALNCSIESLLVPASNRAQDQNVKMNELLKSLDEEERAFVLRLINDFAKLTHSRKRKG